MNIQKAIQATEEAVKPQMIQLATTHFDAANDALSLKAPEKRWAPEQGMKM